VRRLTVFLTLLVCVNSLFAQRHRNVVGTTAATPGIVKDSVSYENSGTSAASKQWAHVNAGNYISVGSSTSSNTAVDSCKIWKGVEAKTSLASIGHATNVGGSGQNLWGVKGPPIGVDTIKIWYHAAVYSSNVSVSYSNVNQTTPLGTAATIGSSSTGTADSVSVSSAVNDVVIAVFGHGANSQTMTATGTGQVKRIEKTIADGECASFHELPGAATSTLAKGTWSGAVNWGAVGVALKPQ
jgi:hypothetical protein